MHKKIKFIFFVIISLFFSITVFAQETKVLEEIKEKITIQPNANSQSGSLTYKDKIGDTSIYVTPQYDKFGGISSNAGLNYNKKFGDSSLFVTPVYNQFGQLSGTAGGTYYEKFGDSLLVVTPQYSKLTGLSTTGSFAIPLTDNFAAGLLLTAGTDKSEIFINSGFRIDDKQRVIFSLGQLRQNLDYNFLSGTENTQVTQNNVGLSYHYFLDKYWINTVEANSYFSKTQSQNLTDKNYYTDTSSLYELWSDPRRIAGGTVEGFQGRLIFLPTEKTILKVGVGGERLNYDVQTGKDTSNYVTANTEISQKIKPNLDLRASVDYTAAENRYAIGLTHNLGTDRKLSLDARTIRGSSFDDKQIFLSYTQAFGKRDRADDKKEIKTTSVVDSNQIRADIINNVRPLTTDTQINQFQIKDNKKDFSSTLLNEVAKRPNYFPAQTIAKVDTSAASTRVIKIDKTNIPDGSSINKSSGILTIPIGTSVSSIAGITKNGTAFTNTGQFALSGNTNLIIDSGLLAQPTLQDTYIVTMNNTTGGGTTLATVKVDRGSTFVSSVVISSGSIAPTITFTIPSKTFGDAAFTLSPTSDSPGAFTFTSSNTSVATISGSIVTIVANGTSTITATQASSGDYSSATATATLTVGVAGTVAAPAFSTAAGAIAFPTTITLSSTTAGATIYYTTDGSTPTTGSTSGTSVVVNSAQTIKAFAIKTGYTDSSISIAAYTQAQATAPTSITLAKGSTAAVGGVTNVAIPSAGATDSTGAVTGWISSTASKIKFTVVNGGSASSTITIGGGAYTSGVDYTITAASTLTVVVTTTETGKTSATRTFSISVAAEPTFTSTGLIINYDASNFSNGASTWTNLGTGGATYNGVVSGSFLLTGTSPAAISIGGNGPSRAKYIDTNYVNNDAAWTVEIIAKALSTSGTTDSILTKKVDPSVGSDGWWFGAQGNTWYYREQTSGANTDRHVFTFTSDAKFYVDGVFKRQDLAPTATVNSIKIITGTLGNTWEVSRFKYYDRTLSAAEISSNSSKQRTELGGF
jgi:hypothetical protein